MGKKKGISDGEVVEGAAGKSERKAKAGASREATAGDMSEQTEGKREGRAVRPESALFEQCYRGRVVPEAEWPALMASLRRDLPVTFRFAAAHPLASSMERVMRETFLQPGALEVPASEGEASPDAASVALSAPLAPLPWLQNAWKLDLPKTVLRRAPGPKRLHNFLKTCTELGVISRQEAVSMVPALLLDSHSGLRVLDLCASPGMKTLQLLDIAGPSAVASGASFAPPPRHAGVAAVLAPPEAVLGTGAVVSNELDGRRCCMLAHHVLRTRCPASLVLHHNALALPPLGAPFDRVLCDVPCSGDGTIRKAPQLLASWRPNRSLALHELQLRIACAGAEQLAEGGRMVYSTCAMSPIENEAVVAGLLMRAAGALELVDCGESLPGLERRPGLVSWEVAAGARQCRNMVFLASREEAAARQLEVSASAWPPSGVAAEALGLPGVLRRCWRMFPHLGDSGGFFVAVLRRVPGRPLPADFAAASTAASSGEEAAGVEGEAEAAAAGEGEEDLPEDAVCKEKLPECQKEAKFAAAGASDRTRQLIDEALCFYGLDGVPVDNFFVRSEGEGRNVYLVSDAVRDVLLAAPSSRVLIGGVRVFDENRFLKSSGCRMRLTQEGVQWLAPLMRRRRCEASPEEMLWLLQGAKVSFKELAPNSMLRRSLEALDSQGSVAVVCELPSGTRLCASAERGAECLSLFVNQHEMRELRETLANYLCPGVVAPAAAVVLAPAVSEGAHR